MTSTETQTGFHKLQQAVLHDPALQQMLCRLTEKKELVARLVEIALELGLTVSTAEIEAGYRAAPGKLTGAQLSNPQPSELRNWMPVEVSPYDDGLAVEWCYMGLDRFTEPFFEDTVRRRSRIPFSRMLRHRTSIEYVAEFVDASPQVPPTGFVFHMSRCGSTLVSQMLASLAKNIVASEAPPIDSVLNASTGKAHEVRGLWLKWIIGALGQQRFDSEQYFFIKFDSWNILDLDLIRRTFPSVPWIFLYRDPVEVIVSQMRQRGSHMVPGALAKLLPDTSVEEAVAMRAEEYCARVLERICKAAIALAGDLNALLVNYSQLPEAVTSTVLKHFGVTYDGNELARIEKVANYNAKTPQLFFEPDSSRKRQEATDAVHRAAERVVPLYRELERLRDLKS